MNDSLQELAQRVDDAAYSAQAIEQLSASGDISVAQAYDIQSASVQKRLDRGEKIVGLKMGFTSKAKAAQMGVNELIYGWITDHMAVSDGGQIDLKDFVHPRVEPELAFRLSAPLSGEISEEEAYAAIEAVAPAMEIIDSRYKDFKFSLADVVADNSSSSGFVIGQWQAMPDNPANLGVVMSFNDKVVQTGSTAAVLGNPIDSVITAAKMLAVSGKTLEAGWIILTGGATAAEALRAGTVAKNEIEGLGETCFSVLPE